MTVKMVEMDHDRQRMVRVISDPVEVFRAMKQGFTLMALDDADILRQTIKGVPIKKVYEVNGLRMAS